MSGLFSGNAVWLFGSLCVCVALGTAASVPSAAAEDRAARSSVRDGGPGFGGRGQVLGGLYGQLRRTENPQSAQIIASTIERLWLKSGSDTVDVLMDRAIGLIQDGELDLALKILDTVVDIAPDFSEGWSQRATVRYLKHNFRESLGDLRRALALDPSHFRAVNGLGLILQALGENKAALKAYRRALQLHPFLMETRRAVDELEREIKGQGI